MKVDFYFSYRSPYSYFILPRIKKLIEEYNVEVNFKLVYPLAIREPSFFRTKNMFTYFFWRLLDYRRVANKLGMSFYRPRPDPISQNLFTGENIFRTTLHFLCMPLRASSSLSWSGDKFCICSIK